MKNEKANIEKVCNISDEKGKFTMEGAQEEKNYQIISIILAILIAVSSIFITLGGEG